MYSNRIGLYPTLIALLHLVFLSSCTRSEENFDEAYWSSGDSISYYDAAGYLMHKENEELKFIWRNVLDSTQGPQFISWSWGKDTIIKGRKLHKLYCDTRDADILLPNQLFIDEFDGRITRYFNGYTYNLVDIGQASNSIDSVYYSFGVKGHPYFYSFNSPAKKGDFAGYSRPQIYSHIDSAGDFGDFWKQVDITFTYQFGITEVQLKQIFNLGSMSDTVKHYTLERVL